MTTAHRGLTILEVLVVVGIIAFLLAAFSFAFSKIRERTRVDKTRALIEKIANGLEAYKLNFQVYPPSDRGDGKPGDVALRYFVTTPFRVTPNPSRGDVAASLDAGPFASFDDNEMKGESLIDAWGMRLSYTRIYVDDPQRANKLDVPPWYDPQKSMAAGSRVLVGAYLYRLYSSGSNRADDGGTGDDILAAK